MEDFVVVDVLQGKTYLREPVKELVFGEVVRSAVLVGLGQALFELGVEVSAVSKVHDDAEFFLFWLAVYFNKTNDVWVIKNF